MLIVDPQKYKPVAQKHRVAMCSDVVNARLNHKTALTLEVTATKPKESIRNKSGKDAIHTLQNNPSQPTGILHNTYICVIATKGEIRS